MWSIKLNEKSKIDKKANPEQMAAQFTVYPANCCD